MCSGGRWGDSTTIKFVQLLQQQQCLWDPSMAEYKMRAARDAALEAIEKGMELPDFSIQDVKNKIKNLRSTYHQELKKIQKYREKGHVYVPRLKWFPEFSEIMMEQHEEQTVMKTEVADSEINEDCDGSDQQEYEEDENQENDHLADDPGLYEVMINENIKSGHSASPKKRPRRFAPRYSNQVAHCNPYPQVYEDEFQMFANSVAAQLRQIPLTNALRMQVKIQTLLAEERILIQENEQ